MADDDIIIEDDAPEPAQAGASPDPDKVIADLKAQLEASEAARAAQESRAREAQAQAQAAHSDAQDNRLALVSTALDRILQTSEILKQNYAAALAASDFAGAAEIQEQIADNAAKKLQLEEGKRQMEAEARQPRRQTPPADPVEAMASQLSGRSADWVRAHPEFARNPKLTQKMLAAHNLAVTDDLQPDTDAYFERVETILGVRRPARAQAPKIEADAGDDDAMSDAAKPVSQRSQQPAAAPTSGGGMNGNRLTVRLTAEQREMAQNMGMDEKDYAKQLIALKKEGKIK